MRKGLLVVNVTLGKRQCRVFVIWPLQGNKHLQGKRRHLRWEYRCDDDLKIGGHVGVA